MSMMGRFVQVSPARLKQIIDDPSEVEELFASDQAAQALPNLMGALTGKLQGRAPQMLAASMAAMPPDLRDRLAQSMKNIGIDPDALERGEGGDDLAKLMAERMQKLGLRLPGQPPASGGSAQAAGKGAEPLDRQSMARRALPLMRQGRARFRPREPGRDGRDGGRR